MGITGGSAALTLESRASEPMRLFNRDNFQRRHTATEEPENIQHPTSNAQHRTGRIGPVCVQAGFALPALVRRAFPRAMFCISINRQSKLHEPSGFVPITR